MPSSTFRFHPTEVAEMEAAALQVTDSIFPQSHVIDALTAKFNACPERAGMGDVKPKQVHNGVDVPRIYGPVWRPRISVLTNSDLGACSWRPGFSTVVMQLGGRSSRPPRGVVIWHGGRPTCNGQGPPGFICLHKLAPP
jgi:hypothetical protein